MTEPAAAVLLRAFMSEDDKCDGILLYLAIVVRARELHLARRNRVPRTDRFGTFHANSRDEYASAVVRASNCELRL